MNYPTKFDEGTQPLDVKAKGATDELNSRGYQVLVGLTRQMTDQIMKLATEPEIREYCPKDSTERFKDLESTERWLSKGRAAFLLVNKSGELVGYGWAGAATSSHAPNSETTFAIRIGKAGQGKGLATPFCRAIVYGAAELFDAKNFWLETWQSNAGAVHIYHKLGFVDVDQQSEERPTKDGTSVTDTRLYMTLPNEMLQE